MFKTVFCHHSISKALLLCGLTLFTLKSIQCKSSIKFPDYIKRCKKDDPHLDACLVRIIESLRSRFDKGILEFGVPPWDPLILPEIVFLSGEKGGIKAKATSLVITGLKDYQIKSLRVNLKTLDFNSTVYYPSIHFEGIYDVNAKFSGFKIKGKGPFRGNASDITSNVFIKGKMVTNEGAQFAQIESAQIDITFKNYHVSVDRLFKNKETNDVFNRVINDPTALPMEQVKALMNDFGSHMIKESVNKMLKSISLDELFL